jgi:hypothetical protein
MMQTTNPNDPSPSPSQTISVTSQREFGGFPKMEAADFPPAVWAVTILLVVVSIVCFISWAFGSRKKGVSFSTHRRIKEQPQTLFNYIVSTVYRHSLEYVFLVAAPLAVGLLFKFNVLSLIGLWGFLITTVSAFYAARADWSSNQAFIQAANSYEEAKRTYMAVVNFAENLESFIEKVMLDLKSIQGDVQIKFLTVLPAFGTVGLKQYYDNMKRIGPYIEFHEYLRQRIGEGDNSSLQILTHKGTETAQWILNILSATKKGPTLPTTQQLQQETKDFYAEQKKYARDLVGTWGIRKVDWRVWDTDRLEKLRGQPPISIPFQFLIVTSGVYQKVYFLFSGSFFYDSVFKAIDVPIDMGSLVMFTKGYYVERDEQVISIFDKIFTSLFEPMNALVYSQLDAAYPNTVTVSLDGKSLEI